MKHIFQKIISILLFIAVNLCFIMKRFDSTNITVIYTALVKKVVGETCVTGRKGKEGDGSHAAPDLKCSSGGAGCPSRCSHYANISTPTAPHSSCSSPTSQHWGLGSGWTGSLSLKGSVIFLGTGTWSGATFQDPTRHPVWTGSHSQSRAITP